MSDEPLTILHAVPNPFIGAQSTQVTQEVTRSGVGDIKQVETEVENTTADPGPGPRFPCQPPPAEPPYQCTLCRKQFPTELALQVHIKANRAAGTRCWRVADITRR